MDEKEFDKFSRLVMTDGTEVFSQHTKSNDEWELWHMCGRPLDFRELHIVYVPKKRKH